MEQAGNIPVFNIPGTLSRIIPRNIIGTFSEYTGNISWECSTNIYLRGGNTVDSQK